jgi:hypothetical protein
MRNEWMQRLSSVMGNRRRKRLWGTERFESETKSHGRINSSFRPVHRIGSKMTRDYKKPPIDEFRLED